MSARQKTTRKRPAGKSELELRGGAAQAKLLKSISNIANPFNGEHKPLPIVLDDPWEHRSEGMRCSTCVSYVAKGDEGKLGRCRKNAPTMGGFPVVFPIDWCGQHRLDETKL